MTIEPQFFEARDGVQLAWREMGPATGPETDDARPLILLHGLFSSAEVNWIKFGTAARIAEAGFRVIMPDLRVHGSSEAPHEPENYPPDVLVHDLQDLIAHLGLGDFDLGGFSLGARTSVRAVVAGMTPRRLILGGMGLAGLAGWQRRGQFFKRVIAEYETAKRGDDTWLSIQFMKTMKIDRVAAALLLDSFTDTSPDMLAALTMPVLLVCGEQDQDNGSAEDLAAALPDARLVTIPGTHMSSVTEPAMGEAIVAFVTA
ncbi:alpha/beta fold hydrolase [Sphingopyxis macrogoltabida]|uniref:Hydrolase n=1 Tax=Sphingopyxis macrogoltabida TaxID=33050 RepID=A0AAC9AWD0_SPHMC|nr:alpha/beta fold hydrolase [Sphingopyxis macrogoltabida]ALJ14903.1 hydrolase [Sphingopyxis macrogoltabida]AMU91154.1 hydrolase [Sphingopyxis macrogoltabida]